MDKELSGVLREMAGTLRRIESLVRAGVESEGYDADACPACGSTNLIDDSTMGHERYVCQKCGAVLTKEAVHG